MTFTPLSVDTLADKVLRFVLGAVLGSVFWFFWRRWSAGEPDIHVIQNWAFWAVAAGVTAVVLGNRFLEWLVNGPNFLFEFLWRRWFG